MTKIIPPKYFRMNLNKKELTKANLMQEVSDVDIYKFYSGQDIGKSMLSPLRDEKKPSFGYFMGNTGEVCFNDFLLGKGDCIKFVQLMFDLDFLSALNKIVIDFNLQDKFFCKEMDLDKINRVVQKSDRESSVKKLGRNRDLKIALRPAELYDISFWMSYGISTFTLRKYNVHPIKYFIINDHVIATDKYAYAFVEWKDGKETYKIYQPFSKDYKWINNHDESVWQGWTQLPDTGDTLIITKSLKDVMAIDEVLGIPSIALQSESVQPKDKIIEELKARFELIHILYDNDYDKDKNWGEIYSKNIANEHQLYFSQVPTRLQSKDFSDLVKNHGEKVAKETWENYMCIPY